LAALRTSSSDSPAFLASPLAFLYAHDFLLKSAFCSSVFSCGLRFVLPVGSFFFVSAFAAFLFLPFVLLLGVAVSAIVSESFFALLLFPLRWVALDLRLVALG
jgi:hypothetical protein